MTAAPLESDREHLGRRLNLLDLANRVTDQPLRDAIAAEMEAADRLHCKLVATRAEADGWAEALRNSERLYDQHLAGERAKSAAVRALHHPVTLMGMVCCDECSTQRSTGPNASERVAYIPHPCRTIQALNGEAR